MTLGDEVFFPLVGSLLIFKMEQFATAVLESSLSIRETLPALTLLVSVHLLEVRLKHRSGF